MLPNDVPNAHHAHRACLPGAPGEAFIDGLDTMEHQDSIRSLIGYCPQHDALLELLTVREHLELFARIKAVPESDVPAVVAQKMQELNLKPFEHKLAGALSGGNKRKLSVAIAMIGVKAPPIVLLDEVNTPHNTPPACSPCSLLFVAVRSHSELPLVSRPLGWTRSTSASW